MLFEKNMEPRCAHCDRCAPLDGETVLCKKKGIMPAAGHCRAFRYDPFKRLPPKPAALDLSRLKDEDFSL